MFVCILYPLVKHIWCLCCGLLEANSHNDMLERSVNSHIKQTFGLTLMNVQLRLRALSQTVREASGSDKFL